MPRDAAEAFDAAAAAYAEQMNAASAEALWCDADHWAEKDIPRRPWVAPGYLLRGAVTLLTGPPSALKSSLVLAWAAALARRRLGRFHRRRRYPVIVYNVEDDRDEQRRRLSATLRQFGATPVDIQGKVIRTGPAGIGTLLIRDDAGAIRFTPAMERLVELIHRHKPGTLIVDPLAELHGCEENDNTALRAVIAKFRELAVDHAIAVDILHHTRKGSGSAPGDPESARGASAIIGAVRIALTLTGMSEDDARAFGLPTDAKARSLFVRLDDAKQNYHAIRDAEWFQKMPHSLDNGEIVPAAEPWTPPEVKIASQFDLAAIAEAIKQGSSTPGREPYSPKMSEDPRSIRQLLITHGFHRADAQKACMSRLVNECDVKTTQFKSKIRKTQAAGLHVDFEPAAGWVVEGGGK